MKNSGKVIPVVAILVLAVAIGGFFGWWVSRKDAPDRTPPEPAPVPVTVAAATSEPPLVARNPDGSPVIGERSEEDEEDEEPEVLEWDDHLDDILGASGIDESEKARRILAMIPGQPEFVQVELTEHLVNLIDDDDYHHALAMLLNPATFKSVSRVLLDDLVNRDDDLMRDTLRQIKSNPNHPLREDAEEEYEFYFDDEDDDDDDDDEEDDDN